MSRKGRKIIEEYWRKDIERKLQESRITSYSQEHYAEQGDKLLIFFNGIGATNVMSISENVDAPKIMFDYKGTTYYTDEIYDWTFDKIIENVKTKVKI